MTPLSLRELRSVTRRPRARPVLGGTGPGAALAAWREPSHIPRLHGQDDDVKPRPPRSRRIAARDLVPPDVPEVSAVPPSPAPKEEPDPVPEQIRKMLEAAYT